MRLSRAFTKNCKKSGGWEPREGRRCTEERLEREQGQAENVGLRRSDFWEETKFRRRN